MGWGGRWQGGSGWGTHVNPWLIHVNVWQKPLQYCKVMNLQLIKINEKKKIFHRHCNCSYNSPLSLLAYSKQEILVRELSVTVIMTFSFSSIYSYYPLSSSFLSPYISSCPQMLPASFLSLSCPSPTPPSYSHSSLFSPLSLRPLPMPLASALPDLWD